VTNRICLDVLLGGVRGKKSFGGGQTRNNCKPVKGKKRGLKVYDGQRVPYGSVLATQLRVTCYPGWNVSASIFPRTTVTGCVQARLKDVAYPSLTNCDLLWPTVKSYLAVSGSLQWHQRLEGHLPWPRPHHGGKMRSQVKKAQMINKAIKCPSSDTTRTSTKWIVTFPLTFAAGSTFSGSTCTSCQTNNTNISNS